MSQNNQLSENSNKLNLTKKQIIYRSVMAAIAVVCLAGIIVLKMM